MRIAAVSIMAGKLSEAVSNRQMFGGMYRA